MTARPDNKIVAHARALALFPDDLGIGVSYGLALVDSGRLQDAATAFRRALHLSGPRHDLLNSLGSILYEARDRIAARTHFRLALTLAPDNAKVLHNHAIAYADPLGGGALTWCDRAIQVDPARIDFAYTRACLLYDRGVLSAAREAYDGVILRDSGHAGAHWNRANIDLLFGNFEDGWRGFEWRWRAKSLLVDAPLNTVGDVFRTGSTIEGQLLVLHAEQGLGDTLQFCRYGRLAAQSGARVILVVPKSLMRLLASQSWVSQVVETGHPLPPFDLSCPMMSLPLAFGTTLETIPFGREAYLQASPRDVERFGRWLAERLPAEPGRARRVRVGLVWSGGFRSDQPELWAVNDRRNVPLEKFAQALDIPGIDFVSLQKGDPSESELRGREGEFWQSARLLNAAVELNDFADTSGLIAGLDLVISVDTSTAHLSAALGKPTWILNRYDTCWRWLLDRDDSPWYPSVKLYRQGADRDWAPTLRRLARDLEQLRDSRPNVPHSGHLTSTIGTGER